MGRPRRDVRIRYRGFVLMGGGSEVIHEFHYGCDLCTGVAVGLVAC
jgi:hypothetical protein